MADRLGLLGRQGGAATVQYRARGGRGEKGGGEEGRGSARHRCE